MERETPSTTGVCRCRSSHERRNRPGEAAKCQHFGVSYVIDVVLDHLQPAVAVAIEAPHTDDLVSGSTRCCGISAAAVPRRSDRRCPSKLHQPVGVAAVLVRAPRGGDRAP